MWIATCETAGVKENAEKEEAVVLQESDEEYWTQDSA